MVSTKPIFANRLAVDLAAWRRYTLVLIKKAWVFTSLREGREITNRFVTIVETAQWFWMGPRLLRILFESDQHGSSRLWGLVLRGLPVAMFFIVALRNFGCFTHLGDPISGVAISPAQCFIGAPQVLRVTGRNGIEIVGFAG